MWKLPAVSYVIVFGLQRIRRQTFRWQHSAEHGQTPKMDWGAVASQSLPLLLTKLGDFNLNLDNHSVTPQFWSRLFSFNLIQHVDFPIHNQIILLTLLSPRLTRLFLHHLYLLPVALHLIIFFLFSLNCLTTTLHCLIQHFILSVVYSSLTSSLLFLTYSHQIPQNL